MAATGHATLQTGREDDVSESLGKHNIEIVVPQTYDDEQ